MCSPLFFQNLTFNSKAINKTYQTTPNRESKTDLKDYDTTSYGLGTSRKRSKRDLKKRKEFSKSYLRYSSSSLHNSSAHKSTKAKKKSVRRKTVCREIDIKDIDSNEPSYRDLITNKSALNLDKMRNGAKQCSSPRKLCKMNPKYKTVYQRLHEDIKKRMKSSIAKSIERSHSYQNKKIDNTTNDNIIFKRLNKDFHDNLENVLQDDMDDIKNYASFIKAVKKEMKYHPIIINSYDTMKLSFDKF
jgi:hypothetical protein